jgi:hypothetical protein
MFTWCEEKNNSRYASTSGDSMFKFRHVRTVAVLAALLAVGSTLSGCYGSFGLTKKLYQANGTIGNKYLKSLVTVLMTVIPVYGVGALADVAIFNLIEFWTGSSPMAANDVKTFDQKTADGTVLHGRKLDDGRLLVTITPVQGEAKSVVLAREVDGVKANAIDGAFLAKVASAADGSTLLITPKAN